MPSDYLTSRRLEITGLKSSKESSNLRVRLLVFRVKVFAGTMS